MLSYYKTHSATESQITYLKKLVEYNNKHRATPKHLDEWINTIYKGSLNVKTTGYLIEIISKENKKFKTEFTTQLEARKLLMNPQRRTINLSDIGIFMYCETAFKLQLRGLVNRNLYELGLGAEYHESLAASEKKDFLGECFSYMQNKNIFLTSVTWFDQETKPYVCNDGLLVGKPDGFIDRLEGERCIIEIKTKNFGYPPDKPYLADILQAVGYFFLINQSEKLHPNVYLLYYSKKNKLKYDYKINALDYRTIFNKTIANMEKIINFPDCANRTTNPKKCKSCGYRSFCY